MQEGGRRRKEKRGRSMRGRGGSGMAGLLLANCLGSGNTVFGRETCDGHVGAGFLCVEGGMGGEGRIKRELRRKEARLRKRHTGSGRGLILMGTRTSVLIYMYLYM